MESIQQTSEPIDHRPDEQPTFDQYVQQLPDSNQTFHRWWRWLIAAAFVLILGVFIYAIYTSFTGKSAGEASIVLAWLYFFLAGAIFALLMGIDTLVLGATLPLPFGDSKNNFETGRKAVREGWALIGYGLVVSLLVIVGVAAVRAGRFSLENWITLVVGFFVILGIGSALLALLRRILRKS